MRTKQIIFFLICCIILVCILPACSNDTPVVNNNNNQGTGGPQPTPIGTPNGTPVTATIGSSGGSMISSDSSMELIIPGGALAGNTDITIQPVANYCYNSNGDAFRLSPDGQQFSQPVTVKLHYSQEVLESTLGILMGIARQDAAGYWHFFNNVSNDTVNRVISVTISHFGLTGDNSSGGGDFSFFDIAHLEPRNFSIGVNQTRNMAVTYAAVPTEEGDELVYLPRPIDSWMVDGHINGNGVVGSIINAVAQSSTFKAPPSVPSPNIVTIQATVNTNINYRGQVIGQCVLQSYARIVENMVYDLKINMNWPDYLYGIIEYHCTYTDGVDMVLTVNTNFPYSVTASNIVNRMPNVTPGSGHYPNGQGTITWMPDSDSGHVNVKSANGTANIFDYISIGILHSNTKSAHFHCVPPQGDPYDILSGVTPGLPTGLNFLARDSTQTFVDPVQHITATLTPRH